MKKYFLLTISFAIFTLHNEKIGAQVIQATGGTRVEIQNAIDSAPNGATIVIPSGNFTIDSKSVVINKNIIIKGAGENATKITSSLKGGYAFTIARGSNQFVRITGICINGNSSSGGVRIVGDNYSFRIDNCILKNCRSRAIETFGNAKGLIDHCKFIDNGITDIVVYGDNDASWNRPLTLGTDNAVYVEDCEFSHSALSGDWHSIASNHGSRYVFRYNKIHDDAKVNSTPIDAHGNFEYDRGSRSYEIYKNTVHSGHSFQGIFIRGGTGVIFDNNLSGDFTYPLVLEDYRSFNKNGSSYYCESYPCIDQIHELYIWNNYFSGKLITPFIQNRGLTREHIKEGRDFFLNKKGDYRPFTYPHPLTKNNDKWQSAENNVPLYKAESQIQNNSNLEDSQSRCGTGVGLALLIPIALQGRKIKKRLIKK